MSTVMTADMASQRYLDQYREIGAELSGAPWLENVREAAASRLAEQGLPTRKTEAWRYTNLESLFKRDFSARQTPGSVDAGSLPALVFGRQAAHRLVFVNGRYDADLSEAGSLPSGVRLLGLADALEQEGALLEAHFASTGPVEQPLADLNTLFAADGFVLILDRGAVLENPVEILFVGAGAETEPAYHIRNLVVAGENSRATVVEHHVGLCIGSYFSNVLTQVDAAAGAIVRHCKVQDETRESFHIAATNARVGAGAMFDSFTFALGGKLSRNEIGVSLIAPGAHCRLNGAYLMKGDQHCDNTTFIDHVAPDTHSTELYKGVVDGSARGVFQGKIIVRPDAQKTDGHQMNRALLLSPNAEVNSKPELEIYADDVKCSHGATAGELDEAALFYMRSRGILELQARKLLVEAFLNEVIDGVALAGMRLPLEQNVARWMSGAGR